MIRKIPEDAFEYYVSLGPGRSHRDVAKYYGVTKRAITRVAVIEGWAERLQKIEDAARAEGERRMTDALTEMHERHARTLKAINARALEALKNNRLNSAMEAVRAAEILIKLERAIAGETSDRSAVVVEQTTRQEIEEMLDVADPEDGDDEDW